MGAAGAFLSETTTPLSTDATFTFKWSNDTDKSFHWMSGDVWDGMSEHWEQERADSRPVLSNVQSSTFIKSKHSGLFTISHFYTCVLEDIEAFKTFFETACWFSLYWLKLFVIFHEIILNPIWRLRLLKYPVHFAYFMNIISYKMSKLPLSVSYCVIVSVICMCKYIYLSTFLWLIKANSGSTKRFLACTHPDLSRLSSRFRGEKSPPPPPRLCLPNKGDQSWMAWTAWPSLELKVIRIRHQWNRPHQTSGCYILPRSSH